MIEIKPLKPKDIKSLEPIENMKDYPELEPGQIAFAGWYEGNIIGAGGLRMFWEGVAEAWLMIARDIPDGVKVKCVLLIRAKLNELIEEKHLWRVQAMVRADFERGISLIEALGFEYEGTMRKYTPDEKDMMIYSKVTA